MFEEYNICKELIIMSTNFIQTLLQYLIIYRPQSTQDSRNMCGFLIDAINIFSVCRLLYLSHQSYFKSTSYFINYSINVARTHCHTTRRTIFVDQRDINDAIAYIVVSIVLLRQAAGRASS